MTQQRVKVTHLKTVKRISDDDGLFFNEYLFKVKHSNSQKTQATVTVADLCYFLRLYCPHIDQRVSLPPELARELDHSENRDNGQALSDYLNQVLFTDPRVVCAAGMREYFILTRGERENQVEALRHSLVGSQIDKLSDSETSSLQDRLGADAPADPAPRSMSMGLFSQDSDLI